MSARTPADQPVCGLEFEFTTAPLVEQAVLAIRVGRIAFKGAVVAAFVAVLIVGLGVRPGPASEPTSPDFHPVDQVAR